MTNKKFFNFQNMVQCRDSPYNHHIGFAETTKDAEKFCDKLNELNDWGWSLAKNGRGLAQYLQAYDFLINKKIKWCEDEIEKIRNDEKDSYIVKHDIAIKILKEIQSEIEEMEF